MTPRQQDTLNYIREYNQAHGHMPTLEEIRAAMGLGSRGGAHRLVQLLVDQGHLYREPGSWRGLRLTEENGAQVLPLLGRIAAGQPIEAIPGEDTLNLSDFLLGPNRYALRVVGESMIGAGILNGDTVVVEQRDSARDGEIIVALIDGQEAMLKRLKRRRDGMVELIADNPAIAPMVYTAERVRIQGVVVGQLRSYR